LLVLAVAASAAAQTTAVRLRPPQPANDYTNLVRRFEIAPLPPGGPAAEKSDALAVPPAREKLYEGLLLIQDQDYSNAIPRLEAAIAGDPSLLGAWEGLGWAYWKLDRKAEAEQLWERLLRLAPQNPMPHNLLASIAVSRKELEKAESLLRQSLSLEPTQFEIRLNLAMVLTWQSKAEEADRLLRDLIQEEPDRTDVRIELAHVAYQLQQYEESAAQWEIVCAVIPDQPEFLIEWARSLLYAGDLEQAGLRAQRAAELDGGSLRALNVLADIAQTGHRPAEAVPQIRLLLDRTSDPLTRSQLRSRLVGLMRQLYDQDPARFPLSDIVKETRAALDEDPRNVNLLLFLAEIHLLNRELDAAYQILDTVRRDMNPNNQRALRALLEIHLARREFDQAEQLIDAVYGSASGDFVYRHLDLARLENARGNYYEAMRHLDRMEREGMKGAVYSLLYHGLSITDWEPGLPARLFREQMLFLKRAGFRFIAPDEIEPYFASRRTLDAPRALPAPYRFLRWLRYAFTGIEPPEDGQADLDAFRPDRVVCVTFDDALRTSFRLGTPVAEEFDVPLAMHVPVGNIARRDYGICSWEEIRIFLQSGVWTIGSHAIDAGIQSPVDAGGYLASPLPNRLWLAAKQRLESLREWSLRVRAEMQDSRAIIQDRLGLDGDGDVRFIAYPYGEIGQMEGCNIRGVGHVPASILHEASLPYRHGFIQSRYGYSTPSDNPLVLGRHEPDVADTGEQVLRHALESHPVMAARRMKAELAALQGKPHLATRMLDLLERDGYPATELRVLRDLVQTGLARRVSPTGTDEEPGPGEGPVAWSKPYLGIDGFLTQANRQIEQSEIGARAGLNLSPALQIEGRVARGWIDQEVVSNRWLMTRETKVSESLVIVQGADNGVPVNKRERTISYQTEEVQTNVVTRHYFDADYTYAGGRLSYQIGDGSILEGRFGIQDYRADEESENVPVGSLSHYWRPAPGLDFATAYDRAVVPSGRRVITSDSVALRALWRARDGWELSAFGRYSYYSDTNALLHVAASSMWLVGERQNIYAGVQYELTTMDDESVLYWCPYWEERFYLALRVQRSFPRFFASAQARAGMAREKGRPEALEKWRALKAAGDQGGWYPGDKPGADWEPSVGLEGLLRRQIGLHWELEGRGACSFYSDYSEFLVGGGLVYLF